MKNDKNINRRSFLKMLGMGGAAALAACAGKKTTDAAADDYKNQVEPPVGKMTYRTNPTTGDKVSLLGYGMMRLPMIEGTEEFDQDMINRQIDYALEHGVNYFDTSPVYCQGKSERCTGIALARHKAKRCSAMEEIDFDSDSFEDIVAKDSRFDARAYALLMDVVRRRKEADFDLLDEFRETALDQYGPMAFTVLTEWGVACTEDIGEMMLNLAEAHRDPGYEDFDNRMTVYGTKGYVWCETDGWWGAFTAKTKGELVTGKNPGWYHHQEKAIQTPYYREYAAWLDDDAQVHSCNIDTACHGYEILEGMCLSALDNTRVYLPITNVDYEPVLDRMARELPDVGTKLRTLYDGKLPRKEYD